jgi:hypothetical protein
MTLDYYQRTLADTTGSAGQEWRDFVDAKGVRYAEVTGTVIPPEAPKSPTATVVYVYFNSVSKVERGKPQITKEGLSLDLAKVGNRWLVSARTPGT